MPISKDLKTGQYQIKFGLADKINEIELFSYV